MKNTFCFFPCTNHHTHVSACIDMFVVLLLLVMWKRNNKHKEREIMITFYDCTLYTTYTGLHMDHHLLHVYLHLQQSQTVVEIVVASHSASSATTYMYEFLYSLFLHELYNYIQRKRRWSDSSSAYYLGWSTYQNSSPTTITITRLIRIDWLID